MSAPPEPPVAWPQLQRLVRDLFPGARLVAVEPIAADKGGDDTHKAVGYGAPLKLRVDVAGSERALVLRTATANDFGHDRRADRAADVLLAYDTFNQMPSHVRALDVGAVCRDGLVSLRGAGELYLVTTFAEGSLYAEDLRRVAHDGAASPLDLARAEALARYLVGLHRERGGRPAQYRRALRDLIGHGEGIFGVVDGYGDEVAGAPPARLQAIERRCVEWRWKLRGRWARLSRTHGDFHPFNLVFSDETRFTALDASRGARGDPADDVAALAINYVFFAVDRPQAWARGLGPLWRRFLDVYLEGSGDGELYDVIAPFLAWRGLVVANPTFYPMLPGGDRDRLLGFVERALDAERFEPRFADELFR